MDLELQTIWVTLPEKKRRMLLNAAKQLLKQDKEKAPKIPIKSN